MSTKLDSMEDKQVTIIKQTESERLYVVETKLDNVLTVVEKTNEKIDDLTMSLMKYATRAELEQAILDREEKIKELKNADVRISKRHHLTVWLTGVLASALGVLITLLINRAFS